MGEVLQTPSGSVIIMTKYDLIEVVRSYCGDNIADYIEQNFKDYDTEEELNEKYFQSDYHSMEVSCDEYTETLSEITFMCKDIQNMLEQKRIDKNKIAEKIRMIENTALEVL